MSCKKCGMPLPQEAQFCPFCGADVNDVKPAVPLNIFETASASESPQVQSFNEESDAWTPPVEPEFQPLQEEPVSPAEPLPRPLFKASAPPVESEPQPLQEEPVSPAEPLPQPLFKASTSPVEPKPQSPAGPSPQPMYGKPSQSPAGLPPQPMYGKPSQPPAGPSPQPMYGKPSQPPAGPSPLPPYGMPPQAPSGPSPLPPYGNPLQPPVGPPPQPHAAQAGGQFPQPPAGPPPQPEYIREGTGPLQAKKKPNKKRIFLIGGIALVVILAAIIIPVSIHSRKQAQYEEGTTLLENREFEQAEEIFVSLGGFSDAADKAAYARQGIEYESAKLLYEAKDYAAAESAFKALGDFEDTAALAETCRKAMDYKNAKELFEAGDYAAAEELFVKAGSYEDAQEMAKESGNLADYEEAKELMEAEDYEAAKELLNPLDGAIIPDLNDVIRECDNNISYRKGQEQLEAGEHYAAYKTFSALGDFEDAEEQAKACIVDPPSTGQTYRNDAYGGSACSLIFKPPTGDGSRTYIKLYSADNTLVSTVFINAGDQAKIALPAGDYRIKAAYSFGDWFGEEDMFGDEGVYELLKSDLTNPIFSLESDWTYTLTLRTSESNPGSGKDVPTVRDSRDGF